MHQEQRQSGREAGRARRTSRWSRAVRLWTPGVGTVITTAIAIYQAWRGQPLG